MAHGHDAQKVPYYSVDKLRLFYAMARRRVARSSAAEDLRMLHLLRASAGSVIDNPGLAHYKQVEAALIRAAQFDAAKPPNQMGVVSKIAERLMRMGAKQVWKRQ